MSRLFGDRASANDARIPAIQIAVQVTVVIPGRRYFSIAVPMIVAIATARLPSKLRGFDHGIL